MKLPIQARSVNRSKPSDSVAEALRKICDFLCEVKCNGDEFCVWVCIEQNCLFR